MRVLFVALHVDRTVHVSNFLVYKYMLFTHFYRFYIRLPKRLKGIFEVMGNYSISDLVYSLHMKAVETYMRTCGLLYHLYIYIYIQMNE